MQQFIKYSMLVLAVVAVFTSCQKAEELPFYESGKGSDLTLSTANVALSQANANQDVVTFSWTDPGFATDTANYKYIVELAPKGTNFANARTFTKIGGVGQSLSLKGAQLNNMLVAWGAAFGTATDLDARIKSSYANNNDLKVSAVSALKVTPYAIPVPLSATSTGPFSPTPQNKDQVMTTLSWTAPDYGSSSVSYTLEYAKAGTNFASVSTLTTDPAKLEIALTAFDLYKMANTVKIPLNTTGSVDLRVKVTVNETNQVYYSTIQTLQVKPVEMTLYMYVAGDFQGWNPGAAPRIGSTDGVNYEGYVWVPTGGTGEFKITSQPNWDGTNYGGTSTVTGGVLDVAGGNLKWPATGKYYRMQVNMNAMTWKVTETNWGVIGAATPGGWDNSTPLVYDPALGKWKATVSFTAGEFKFRANNGWDINMGADGGNPPYLRYDGDNIAVPAGSKTVLLDLSNPLKYTYTLQ